jgi:transposase
MSTSVGLAFRGFLTMLRRKTKRREGEVVVEEEEEEEFQAQI